MVKIDRRAFLFGSGAALASAGCRSFGSGGIDPNLSVFVSDLHIKPGSYQKERFDVVVDRILAMSPCPANVVVFGDIAWIYGKREDYETSRPQLRRLIDAGIRLTLGMGNHDHRANFLAYWPECAKTSPVPDRVVSVVDLGACDLILLDTLYENTLDETVMTTVPGQMTGAQWKWLKGVLPGWRRPVFLGAHHDPNDLADGDRAAFNDLVMSSPAVVGYIHGHDHFWRRRTLRYSVPSREPAFRKRLLTLPSTGHWGDIGYVVFRTAPGRAEAELVELDHYFTAPTVRSAMDEDIARENNGQRCVFRFD